MIGDYDPMQNWGIQMAYFPDLSPYAYTANELPQTVKVGWLEASELMPTGKTSEEFQEGLQQLCNQCVRQTRGLHVCSYCYRVTGSAEIRVPGGEVTYAAPELIFHYVVAHGYKPPDEFIASVLAYTKYMRFLAFRSRFGMGRGNRLTH